MEKDQPKGGLTEKDMVAGSVVFTHVDDDGTETTVSVEHLHAVVNEGLKQGILTIHMIPVERDFAKFCLAQRGVERHRLTRLSKEWLQWEPIIFAEWPDGTHLLLDGHHRYVKANMMFRKKIRAVILPPDLWRPCVVHGMEPIGRDTLMSMYSGIN